MGRVYLFLFVANIVLTVIALIDCLGSETAPRNLSRLVWALIILFFTLVGPIAWFLVGRPHRGDRADRPGPRRRTGGRAPEAGRPLAPDDDPEFLESLKAQQDTGDDEMFRRWEADLRRREEDLRRKDDDAAGDGDGTGPVDPGTDEKR